MGCATEGKPYDWLITTVLVLAHNICVGCFDIRSYDEADAIPVLNWLNGLLGTNYILPY